MSVTSKKNYYEILKISPLSGPSAVKKSYQRLARLHHPDKNPNNPQAEETFRQINEAYEILSDTFKRKAFDRELKKAKEEEEQKRKNTFSPLYESYHSHAPSSFSDPSTSAPQPTQPSPLSTTAKTKDKSWNFFSLKSKFQKKPAKWNGSLELSLEEAALGCVKNILLKKPSLSFSFHSPPGVQAGQSLKLPTPGGKFIYLSVKHKPHPLFTLKGKDIFMNLPVPLTYAVLGGKQNIPTLRGKAILPIPPHTSSGQVLRLKGEGFPSEKKGGKVGDMFITVLIDIPTDFTEEEKNLLRKRMDKNVLFPKTKEFDIKCKNLWESRKRK